VEVGPERLEERGIIEQPVHRLQLSRHSETHLGRSASHKVGCAFTVLNMVASIRTSPTGRAIIVDWWPDEGDPPLTFSGASS